MPAAPMLSALDLARRIEDGAITAADVLARCAAAIAEREAEIGAFTIVDIEAAKRQAAVAKGPLAGLPVALKDIIDTADLPTEYGSSIYRGHRPAADAALTVMVRKAGGAIIGKTVTAEFAHQEPGRTRNPRNPAHTPGGSSSGSAAAVAAGFAPIALGSQTGGSTIRPASFCGVAGYKPSYALLPTVGMKCVSWHLDTVGLFAASVADVAFAAAVIAGRDLRVDGLEPGAPRIAVPRRFSGGEPDAAMADAVERAARAAESAGARVTAIDLPPVLDQAYEAHGVIHAYEVARSLAFEHDRHRDALSASLRALIEKGQMIGVEAYDEARRTTRRGRRAILDLFGDIDILLSPSAASAAPEGLAWTGPSTFNRLWTLMGTPCVSIPGLEDVAGMPLGIQAIGRFGRDRTTLAAARQVEQALAKIA